MSINILTLLTSCSIRHRLGKNEQKSNTAQGEFRFECISVKESCRFWCTSLCGQVRLKLYHKQIGLDLPPPIKINNKMLCEPRRF